MNKLTKARVSKAELTTGIMPNPPYRTLAPELAYWHFNMFGRYWYTRPGYWGLCWDEASG